MLRRGVAHDPPRDRGPAFVPARVAGDVADGEKRLEPVHVGVRAAIRLGVGPVARERLPQRLRVLVPQVGVDEVDDALEQGGASGCPAATAEAAPSPTCT